MTYRDAFPELLDLAKQAAVAAGKYIQSFDRSSLKVDLKTTGTSIASQVVTQLDLEAEEIIYDVLKPSLKIYDLAFLAEESASLHFINEHPRFTKPAFWCVDPLDGTLPFVEGQEGYAVSIALVSNEGEALLAAVYDPYLQKLWSSDSVQTYEKKQNGNRLTLFCDRSLLKSREYPLVDSIISQLKNQYGFSAVEVHQQFGAVKNALGVLTTPNSLYLKVPKPEQGGGSLWDFAATTALFQKVKKPCGGINGMPINLNKPDSLFMNDSGILYASDEQVFAETVKTYQPLVNH